MIENSGVAWSSDRFMCRLLRLGDAGAGARLALDAQPDRLTYAGLAATAGAVARTLSGYGVVAGDRVVIAVEYGPRWVSILVGALAAGVVAVPVDRHAAPADLAAYLRDTDPAVVVAEPDDVPRLADLLGAARLVTVAECVSPDQEALPGRGVAVEDVVAPDGGVDAAHRKGVALVEPVPRSPGDAAMITYTSGTTGSPRGVTVSWGALAYQVTAGADRQRVAPDAVFVSVLPGHHLFELIAGCLVPLYAGARVHFAASRLPADIAAAITAQRATDMVAVPALLAALRRWLVAAPGRRVDPGLRRFFVGGAPLDPGLALAFQQLGFDVCQGYGLSEASPIVATNTPWENRIGSVGRPLPGTEVRVDADGELLARGPGVMSGYWGKPELTAEAINEDGWLRTGDLGRIDTDGYIHVTGRRKNLIVLPSGQNVQPEQVEAVLGRSDLVGEVCVLGHPTEHGEELVAVVTASDRIRGELADAADRERALTAEVRRLTAGLAPYQRPRRIVVHDDALPRTATRKIRRDGIVL
ncbi:AMP-binding protein [Krasilnikovia sp. MM14-A1259]|uniref:AMP-binding protein n=1 Tax=Krasilnikovia sp. MM14-A1259 TaxID=3373539 RepID=UPI00381B4C19